MKPRFSHILVAILATFISTNVAQAQTTKPSSYSFSKATKVWKTDFAGTDPAVRHQPGFYRQAAASDGRIFTVPGGTDAETYPAYSSAHVSFGHVIGNGTQFHWSGGSKNDKMPYTSDGNYYYLGPAIAADEEGTLWCTSLRTSSAPGSMPWAIGAKAFTYYTTRPVEGNTEGVKEGLKIAGTGHETSGRADLMSVSGKGVNGVAYFWFAIAGTNKIECIVMEKAKTIRKLTFTAPVTFANEYASGYVKQFAGESRLLLNVGSSADQTTELYLGSISGSLYDGTATVTWNNPGPTGLMVSRYGSTAFLLNGHGIIVYSTSPTTIRIYDWTAQRELDVIKPFGDAISKSTYVSHSMDVKVNGNTAELYIYSPGVGGAKYTITSSEFNDPVPNLKATKADASSNDVIVSWDKPTQGTADKYSVSYSSDGGSTWSTAVETTNLSHTFENLPIGYYIFKVTPYYYYSPSSYKWGQEAKSGNVAIGDFNPVSNVNVAYAGNLGNSIAVSWNAPESQIAPEKYQVCHSNNHGTSWSSAVETTDLTYTFTDLTVGTYIFKVTPIYNGVPGEETTSETISVAESTGFTFTTTKRWQVSTMLDSDGSPCAAVSNNMMYFAVPKTLGTISYASEGLGEKPASVPSFPSGYDAQYIGYPMDNDDAGNIIIKSGNAYYSAATQFTIYPKGATSNAGKKEITLSGNYLPGARADFIAAQGNLLSAEGGYVWIAPNSTQEILRIKIVNGALAGIDKWTHSLGTTSNTNQILLRPLADGRLYLHFRSTGYYIITLPPAGEAITSDMMTKIEATGTYAPINLVSSDMFILQGHTFHVRSDGAKDKSIGIAIRNLTDVGNGDITYTPFNGVNANEVNSGVSSSAGYGSIVRAVKVDDYNYDVYSYSEDHGITVYRVSAKESFIKTDKLASLTYNYIENTDDSGNKVQNIELTWEAPKEATPSNYKIYRNGSLVTTVDASTLTYTDKGVSQNNTYKVVPIFAGVNEDALLGLEVTTTEVENILYAPVITEVRNYDGYSIVEIFYQMPSYNKVKPATYNVYRNGVLLGSGLTQYNFIDDQLPKVLKDIDYTYTVEAVYGANYNNETRSSEDKIIKVKARDWSLSGYQLQEIYNIAVSQAIGNLPNNFTNHEYYRQGHFYNGSWYIAQRADNLAKKDDPNYTASDKGTEIVSGIAGTTGGVVTIKAIEGNDVLTGFTGKPITSEAFASVGLAMDDAGNIFMRYNNDSNADMATTAPAIDQITGLPVSWLTYVADGFTRRITRGAIYKRNADGTYETTPIVLNLNTLWTSNDWINTMAFTYQNGSAGDKNGQVTGRSDYYSMSGDVMSAEGGYLILSPSWTRTIFKIKIANGQYVNHETHQIDQYQSANGMVNVKTGTENYGFKLDGRNSWMAQIRSNGYFGIHGEEENHEEGHEHETHAIFVTDSRINNSGGTSIVAFDNETTAENDGETFLITPASMYSRNQGDFIVTRGTKENIGDLASEAKFMPPMPVAQMKQTSINSNVATNANGNWCHAEKGTYLNTDGEDAECVYIYQYVPGIRFAKYRLIPDLSLPVVSPTLEITTAYNEEKTEITHFNGRSTWKRPETFGLTNSENSSVWIKSYTFELLDAHGNVVYSDEVPEAKDAEGNILMDYSFDYVADKNIDNVDNCDLDFQTYTARIAVNYEFINGDIQQSAFNYAIDDNNYPAKPANNTSIDVFLNENFQLDEWVQDENGKWVVESRKVNRYRVDLDFNKPDFSGEATTEPVSYYTIKAIVNRSASNHKGDTINIDNFLLHQGSEVKDGKIWAKTTATNMIPGTYNFNSIVDGGDKAPYYTTLNADGTGKYQAATDGGSYKDVVLSYFYDAPITDNGVAVASNGEEITITNTPDKWEFIIVAHYAARNRYINKDVSVGLSTEFLTPTGVEVIGDGNIFAVQIYPIPAHSTITVKSPEAINSIVIYNEAGAEVMNIEGDGETITTVNIESLATGYYFVKVNNQELVKIIKK